MAVVVLSARSDSLAIILANFQTLFVKIPVATLRTEVTRTMVFTSAFLGLFCERGSASFQALSVRYPQWQGPVKNGMNLRGKATSGALIPARSIPSIGSTAAP